MGKDQHILNIIFWHEIKQIYKTKYSVYQDAASVSWLIFHLHIAKMKNSCQNLVNCQLITFIDSYKEKEQLKQ